MEKNGWQAMYGGGGWDGRFVQCEDVNGLNERIGKVLERYAKSKEIGSAGKISFRELFQAKGTGEAFLKTYKARVT